jgi:formate dehydrogenase major subunit
MLDGREVEAAAGAPLVEVIKQNGVWISNLCYIDGLPPYAGCRTCLVEIEGARGLQLSCTARVAEGMVVRTDTAAVKDARQAVLSIINANHSDRCLTCHRRVKCMPGDICLRDDTVSHRCLTCAKNYRCELQTTNEMLQMANYEPWLGEERTYYESEQPEPDRANPFLEFDPQMCIICTRCVRACDEVRHTGAITLAGRGFSTRIAFGAGGAIHESSCDFCGACIDVCPTATLLEKPNKWVAKTETWVSTACNSCSVGCTLSMGVRNGRVVMVKPDLLNPVSNDQICVRGRFHYDAIKPRERLLRQMTKSAGRQTPATFEDVLGASAERLASIIRERGADAVGVLVGPWMTNEEAYLAARLARDVIGTPHLDSTAGPVADAVSRALVESLGTDVLPSDLSRLATASTIVVIADDLESSHNVAALRVKDAVVRGGATLIVISSRYGEVCDFIQPPPAGSIMPSPMRPPQGDQTGVWLRPAAGREVAAAAVLARLVAEDVAPAGVAGLEALRSAPAEVGGVRADDLARASAVLKRAALGEGRVAVVYAPNPASPRLAGLGALGAANLALLCSGERAPEDLHVLPAEANVNGIRDMGVRAGGSGLSTDGMLAAAREGRLAALVVVGDNPLMHSRGAVAEALEKLDCLVVIDSLPTETARRADFLFASTPAYAREGTYTSADRRLVRLSAAEAPAGAQRDALATLHALGVTLAARLGKPASLPGPGAAAVLAEAAARVPGYAGAAPDRLESGVTRALPDAAYSLRALPVETARESAPEGQLILTTSRPLFTSLEGASIRSAEADKLHREEFVEVNPADAAALGIRQNHPVVVANGRATLTLPAALTDAVAPGSVYIPSYLDGGSVFSLLPAEDEALPLVSLSPAGD